MLDLEKEKHVFEECYELWAREKPSLKEQVATSDGAVECLSQWIETLVEEKKALETQVEIGRSQLEVENMRMNTVEEDVVWFLHKGVVRVVDKVIESVEFSLGGRHMKEHSWFLGWRMVER